MTLLLHSELPIKYQRECVLTFTYPVSSFPSQALKDLSPYQLLFGQIASYEHFRVYIWQSSLCIYFKGKKRQISSQSGSLQFLGYPFSQKAYKLLNLEAHQLFTSTDVPFHEQGLPYHLPHSTNKPLLFCHHKPFYVYDPKNHHCHIPLPLDHIRPPHKVLSSIFKIILKHRCDNDIILRHLLLNYRQEDLLEGVRHPHICQIMSVAVS